VAKLLFHQGEIDICRNQMAGNRVLQNMGMLLFCWHPGCTSNRPEQPEKLRAIKPSALLTRKDIIRAVIRTLPQPFTKGFDFVQQRLSTMLGHSLCGAQRPE